MKKTFFFVSTFFYLALFFSSCNNPKGYVKGLGVTVSCGSPQNLLLTSTVNITIQNQTSDPMNQVAIKITAYGEDGEVVKEKIVTFDRTLAGYGTLSKITTLPAKAKSCACEVSSAQ